jgi:hypothetical protein
MQLRVAVVGAQTQRADAKKPYTVYRTVVNYRGQCFQRLIRYWQFRWFHRRLDRKDAAQLRDAVFPQKKWTRSASLQDEVVEERQVMLDEYMRKVSSCELTAGSYDRLLRLVQVGPYDVHEPALPASVSHKPPVASTSCERSVGTGGEPSEATPKSSSGVALIRPEADSGSGGVAVGPSIVLRSMASSAETVLTDDDERVGGGREGTGNRSSGGDDRPVRPQYQQTTRKAQSLVRNSSPPTSSQPAKKVQFDVNDSTVVPPEAPAAAAEDNEDVALSPAHKYKEQIDKKMSDIQDVLSSFRSLEDGPLGGRQQQPVVDASK